MYKSFETIRNFIKDIYGCDLLSESIDERISHVEELIAARLTMRKIIDGSERIFSRNFLENVLPLLEVALQWNYLKQANKISEAFMEKCRKRITASGSNFRGIMFELDMATRCLLSGWDVDFPEIRIKNAKVCDLIVKKPSAETIALECVTKRGANLISVEKIIQTINEKKDKFKPENLTLLGAKFAKKIVVVDLTNSAYKIPEVVNNFHVEEINEIPYVDGVVLTWKEDFIKNEDHSIENKV